MRLGTCRATKDGGEASPSEIFLRKWSQKQPRQGQPGGVQTGAARTAGDLPRPRCVRELGMWGSQASWPRAVYVLHANPVAHPLNLTFTRSALSTTTTMTGTSSLLKMAANRSTMSTRTMWKSWWQTSNGEWTGFKRPAARANNTLSVPHHRL